MFCSNCGFNNTNNNRFCENCGYEFKEKNIMNLNEKKGIPVLSWVSFGLLILKIVLVVLNFVTFFNGVFVYFLWFPFLFGSLITAIVSRVMNRDVMSLVVMIIDIVLIVLIIIFMVWIIIIINQIIYTCESNSDSIIQTFQACGQMG